MSEHDQCDRTEKLMGAELNECQRLIATLTAERDEAIKTTHMVNQRCSILIERNNALRAAAVKARGALMRGDNALNVVCDDLAHTRYCDCVSPDINAALKALDEVLK